MATTQSSASVQNDGNFAHLELFDPVNALSKRVEVFRCSQPIGCYGITGSGSPVDALCGADHLSSTSNRLFRGIYSEGQGNRDLPILIEFREEIDPDGLPAGSIDVRVRDLTIAVQFLDKS
jgi:hypothetical protein